MGRVLVVSNASKIDEHKKLAEEYGVSFELNDFFNPQTLCNEEKIDQLIQIYQKKGIPKESTMHGAFYDIVLFSEDPMIQEISQIRMIQSMEIAKRLQMKGVVFHTNVNPILYSKGYLDRVVSMTVSFIESLLKRYNPIEIYLENMFDSDPQTLLRISEPLSQYENYGVCLDFAHASLSATEPSEWIDTLMPYLKHIHINDNDLKHDLHLALGTGQIDLELFFNLYQEKLTKCSLLIETSDPENQRISLEYLKRRHAELLGNA